MIHHEGDETSITITIGLVEAIENRDSIDTLMLRADDLLYKGKMSGRDRVYSQ